MTWSASDHLAHGLQTIRNIEASPLFSEYKPRVCFHFAPSEPSDDEPWGEGASYCVKARPLFDSLEHSLDVDYVGGTSGIEAYDSAMPSERWLSSRLSEVMGLAGEAGLIFEGWSFEPIEPADATYFSCGPTLEVFNSKSPEGQAAIEQLKREVKEMSDGQ